MAFLEYFESVSGLDGVTLHGADSSLEKRDTCVSPATHSYQATPSPPAPAPPVPHSQPVASLDISPHSLTSNSHSPTSDFSGSGPTIPPAALHQVMHGRSRISFTSSPHLCNNTHNPSLAHIISNSRQRSRPLSRQAKLSAALLGFRVRHNLSSPTGTILRDQITETHRMYTPNFFFQKKSLPF